MLSKRLQTLTGGDFVAAFKLAGQLKDPIDLSVGFPEGPTPPHIKAAGIEAIQQDRTRYHPASGILPLRQAIAAKLSRHNHLNVTANEVTVTPGVTAGILLTYLAILDAGDEILVPDPAFPPYLELVPVVGAVAVRVSTYPDFQLTAERLAAHITPKTKAVVVNTPHNPTGAVYPQAELRRIAQLAQRHNLVIIADEMYEHFTYGQPHASIGQFYDRTVTLNGFSKAYSMTGWRVGYMAGPAEVIEAVTRLQQFTVFSNSSIAEYAALAALNEQPDKLADGYRRKRDMVREVLGEVVDIQGAEGAFFAFVQVPKGMDDLQFCARAAERGVIVLPSRAFSARRDYVRISFAAPEDKLRRGLAVLADLLRQP